MIYGTVRDAVTSEPRHAGLCERVIVHRQEHVHEVILRQATLKRPQGLLNPCFDLDSTQRLLSSSFLWFNLESHRVISKRNY